jgi:hypothetical protein
MKKTKAVKHHSPQTANKRPLREENRILPFPLESTKSVEIRPVAGLAWDRLLMRVGNGTGKGIVTWYVQVTP